MNEMLKKYINILNEKYLSGQSTEHSFRPVLEELLKEYQPDFVIINEARRQECGAPDFIINNVNNIPIGYIETKNINDNDLTGEDRNKEQFDRYKEALPNIIFTDYLDFYFYRNFQLLTSIRIAEIIEDKIIPIPCNFDDFERQLNEFYSFKGQNIKNPTDLAKLMAGKAKLLANQISRTLQIEIEEESIQTSSNQKESLLAQYKSFQKYLIHNISIEGFSDAYAQTITYGLFAARSRDTSKDTFSRQEALSLIPKSNPFLKSFFTYIASNDLDERVSWIIDELVTIYSFVNLEHLLKNYGKETDREDPIIHFFEDFLEAYDGKTREQRGVWYTPKPIVDFIVRSVDEILVKEFDLQKGIADSSKVDIRVKIQDREINTKVHKVQILDPAVGTGTFLNQVVNVIHEKYKNQQGQWEAYVTDNLIPRLNGFELLMAPYAIAHLKLDLTLQETGYDVNTQSKSTRFNIFLTDSLEEAHSQVESLFTVWLSNEANLANYIKRDAPVMCIIGNPPYSGESINQGEWITELIDDYKKEPGGKIALDEKNPKWISDDYVKFIRMAQFLINKNKKGVIAFINPHGYLDNPTFRGMRWNLLKDFDKIYTLDLHGNATKNEVSPDGTPDKNVFDIKQGVSINIFIKTGKKKANELGKIYHHEIYGSRESKFDYLCTHSYSNVPYQEVNTKNKYCFFVPKEYNNPEEYKSGIPIKKLFKLNSVGIVTARDNLVIDFEEKDLIRRINRFCDKSYTDNEVRYYYFDMNYTKNRVLVDTSKWSLSEARKKIRKLRHEKQIKNILYRPFDVRYIYHHSEMIERDRKDVMQHMINHNNVGLAICRQYKTGKTYQHISIANGIIDLCYVSNKTSESTYLLPLYLYIKNGNGTYEKVPNLDCEIAKEIANKMGATYVANEEDITENVECITPLDILDYIYAVLHSPNYRSTYNAQLKEDFPLVPYPNDIAVFRELVAFGSKLRQLHLLESSSIDPFDISYPIAGNNKITRLHPKYEDNKVYINKEQYFGDVPEEVWDFYVGGYQPAQKWLKDRKERELNSDEIEHYQKIICSLKQTIDIMEQIDELI